MPTLIIKTNVSQATAVLIKDMGINIPASGGSTTFTSLRDFEDARLSKNLRALTTDNAFGAGSSTLIINDGTTNIAQAGASDWLDGYPATRIKNFAGSTELAIGTIADGQTLIRSGASVVGTTVAASLDLRSVFIYEHFMSSNGDTDEMGSMGWRSFVSGSGSTISFTGAVDRPGIVLLSGGTATTSRSAIALGDSAGVGGRIFLGGTNPLTLEFMFRFPAAADFAGANLEEMHMGYGLDWIQDASPTNGLFVRYVPGTDSFYTLVATTSGVSTTLVSTVAPSAATWMKFIITYTPSSGLATYSIDGTAVSGSISTNIPSAGMGIGMKIRAVGTATGPTGQWCYVIGMQTAP